jgi:hypothetical protein
LKIVPKGDKVETFQCLRNPNSSEINEEMAKNGKFLAIYRMEINPAPCSVPLGLHRKKESGREINGASA